MKAEIAMIAKYKQNFQNLPAKYPDFMGKVDARTRENRKIEEAQN